MSEQTNQWLAFAGNDLQAAEVMLREDFYTHTCFLAQQTVEKALKAVLVQQNLTVPRIHSIVTLAQLMPPELMARIEHDLSILDDYYIPVRYPDLLPGGLADGPPGQHEASRALVVAQDVMHAVVNHLAL